jgi:hypothetical protein
LQGKKSQGRVFISNHDKFQFLIVHCTISLVELRHRAIDGLRGVSTFVGFACALEVFVFNHPELFAVVETFEGKKMKKKLKFFKIHEKN